MQLQIYIDGWKNHYFYILSLMRNKIGNQILIADHYNSQKLQWKALPILFIIISSVQRRIPGKLSFTTVNNITGRASVHNLPILHQTTNVNAQTDPLLPITDIIPDEIEIGTDDPLSHRVYNTFTDFIQRSKITSIFPLRQSDTAALYLLSAHTRGTKTDILIYIDRGRERAKTRGRSSRAATITGGPSLVRHCSRSARLAQPLYTPGRTVTPLELLHTHSRVCVCICIPMLLYSVYTKNHMRCPHYGL